jgi:hypothetical protein
MNIPDEGERHIKMNCMYCPRSFNVWNQYYAPDHFTKSEKWTLKCRVTDTMVGEDDNHFYGLLVGCILGHDIGSGWKHRQKELKQYMEDHNYDIIF